MNKKLDALKELFNIGVGGSANALYKIIKVPIMVRVPEVYLTSIDKAMQILGPLDKQVVSVYVKVSDGIRAGILLIMDEDSAKNLVKLVSGVDCNKIDNGSCKSVLKEVTNILSSYFLSTLASFLKMCLIPDVPLYAFDMQGAIIDYVFADREDNDLDVLFVLTELFSKEKIRFNFILVPEKASLDLLFDKINI